MRAFFYILGAIIWIAIAFWPASVANRKGHSFLGWFIISIFFWWIALFVVYFGLSDKNAKAPSAPAKAE